MKTQTIQTNENHLRYVVTPMDTSMILQFAPITYAIDIENRSILIQDKGCVFLGVWPFEKSDPDFLSVCANMTQEDLLAKISQKTEFDLVGSKRETLKNIDRYFEGSEHTDNYKKLVDLISKYSDSSEESWFRHFCEMHIGDLARVGYPEDFVSVKMSYPGSAVFAAMLFTDEIQPKLKKLLSDR